MSHPTRPCLAHPRDRAALRVACQKPRAPWLGAWLLVIAASLTTSSAFAQQEPPVAEPETSTAPAETNVPTPTAPLPAEVEPAPLPVEPGPRVLPGRPAPTLPLAAPTELKPPSPSAVPTPKVPSAIPLRAYGILWASVFSTQPVQSFGNATSVAPTAAVNPALFKDSERMMLSFQVQQTRLGLALGEGTPLRGTVEIDFVHFDQSSPLAQAYPRIRIGLLEWIYRPNQKFFLGQTWDIFGNATGPSLLSHSFNLVGTLFQAGNIGFLRQQLGWAGRFGDLEISAAAGMQGANAGTGYNHVEASDAPTGAARLMYHLPKDRGVVGVSGIGTALRFNEGERHRYRAAGAGQMFADVTFGALNLHAELYAAQNIANTGSLNLGQGRYDTDVADAGGYVSGKLTQGNHAFTAMAGYAAVLRPSRLVPGYSAFVPAMGGAAALNAHPNPSAGPGIDHNMTAHLGYWYSPLKGLSLVVEPYVYSTKYKLAATDMGRVAPKNTSWGVQFGSMYQF